MLKVNYKVQKQMLPRKKKLRHKEKNLLSFFLLLFSFSLLAAFAPISNMLYPEAYYFFFTIPTNHSLFSFTFIQTTELTRAKPYCSHFILCIMCGGLVTFLLYIVFLWFFFTSITLHHNLLQLTILHLSYLISYNALPVT